MQRVRFDDQSALVTGAGSGIGRETALLLAARGARLFLVDVAAEALGETASMCRGYGNAARTECVDVSDREAMARFSETVHRDVPAVDILVNNAGVGLGASFLDTSLSDWEWIVGVNVWGVIHGCHFFVPRMVERKQGGHVVNVASAAGYVGTAELSAYATTKFAVVGLSEALRDELAPHGIGVSTICPGIIDTSITQSARLRGAAAADGERERLIGIYKRRNYGPRKVAEAIVDAIERNRAVVPVTPEAWVMYALKRAAPSVLPKIQARLRRRFTKER
jgi:NAD(P)-dependent dehydrogenase (short-subunit alcohol dehydrogenase family)